MKKYLLVFTVLGMITLNHAQVTNGLVAHYSFNEANADDEAGTAHGNVVYAIPSADRFGNANAAFNFFNILTDTAYIDCGNPLVVQGLDIGYSISVWFKRQGPSVGLEAMVCKWAPSVASEHFFLGVNNDDIVWATAGPGNVGTTVTTNFSMNQWHHVVLTWDSSGVHNVYVDNVLTSNVDLASHTVTTPSPVNLMIGTQDPGYRQFNGEIDDIRIYNRIISAAEVDSLFDQTDPIGIAEEEWAKYINIYPNPATDYIYINNVEKFTGYSIITTDGKYLVENISNKQAQIKIDNLLPGVYILQLHTDSQILNKRFIKL